MPTIKIRSHIGEDGILHLDIPSDFRETEVNVTVTVEVVKEDLAARKESRELHYNAWGKPITQESIIKVISEMRRLQKAVALDKSEIRAMREEGRRF